MGRYGLPRRPRLVTLRGRTLLLAVGLTIWPYLLGSLPLRYRPVAGGVASTALVVATRSELGLRGARLGAGLRLGGMVAAAVAVAVGCSPLLPGVRASMRERVIGLSPALWLGLHIPVGTVWAEELAFRGVLEPMAASAFGPRLGRLVQATAFGLSHIHPARAAGDSVPGTIVATGFAGWLLGWLRGRSGSVAAPMLVHLALNETGALTALAVQRHATAV